VTDRSALEQNACGEIGFNCGVTVDGGVQPIKVGGSPAVIQITPAQIADGFFSVVPNRDADLEIALSGYSFLSLPTSQAPELVPAFTAALVPRCAPR
jgi:hypothetical protein